MKQVVEQFLDKGLLVSPDFIKIFDGNMEILKLIKKKMKDKPLILNKDLFFVLKHSNKNVEANWLEFEKSKALFEKGKDGRIYETFLNILNYEVDPEKKKILDNILKEVEEPERKVIVEKDKSSSSAIVLKNYIVKDTKVEVQDFVNYFKLRYEKLRDLLRGREELRDTISINRALQRRDRESVVLIGLIADKRSSKKGNIIITLEDPTGKINVVVNQNRKEVFDIAKDCVLDEVIGVTGVTGERIVFVDNVLFPDIPVNKEFKKSDDESYAIFTADFHVGSTHFLKDDLLKFIEWINGNSGSSKQKEIAKKVKYLFIVGDLVAGVGIYPDQDKELVIKDVKKQYALCAELLGKIRKDLNIVICAGNHDALRISEPQPVLDKNYANDIYDLPNVTIVTNPSWVNIHSSKDFPGFDVLLYHGYSFYYYSQEIESIRLNGGTARSDLIMKFLLQRRHLAPAHTSTLYIPNVDEDYLVIDKVPDFFITAHMHKTTASHYKNVALIGCGCWEKTTPYMEKQGIEADPSRITLVNLKTRDVKILKFGD